MGETKDNIQEIRFNGKSYWTAYGEACKFARVQLHGKSKRDGHRLVVTIEAGELVVMDKDALDAEGNPTLLDAFDIDIMQESPTLTRRWHWERGQERKTAIATVIILVGGLLYLYGKTAGWWA
jgi:hypothetical protein